MTDRPWEPWQLPSYAESRLEIWGDPTSPIDKWNVHKYNRLKKLPRLIEGNTVLDVGCGCGHTYTILKEYVKEYLGVDSAKAMIDICHRFFPEHLFKVGDIYDLSPFGIYDTVISTQVLIHLPDIERPLEQLWRHTGQTLIFTLRPITHRVTLRKSKPEPLNEDDKYYLIGHNYSIKTVINAINKLENKGDITIYYVEDAINVMYIKITRDKTGHNKKYNVSIFDRIIRCN